MYDENADGLMLDAMECVMPMNAKNDSESQGEKFDGGEKNFLTVALGIT